MDHVENQSSPKTLANSYHKNISSNEDANTSSQSEKNELERYFVRPDEMLENRDVFTNDDAGSIFLGSDRLIFGKSEQETLQSTKSNSNFSNMIISAENAASDSAPDSCFLSQQQESHLGIWQSSSHPFHSSFVSDDKVEEFDSYSLTSIFGAESKANKILITKSKIYVYDETLTSTSQKQNDVPSSTVFTDSSSEEFRTAIDTSNRDIPINSDVCMPGSFEAIEGGIQLDPTIVTAGTTGSSGITSEQGYEDVQDIYQRAEEPRNEISTGTEASEDDRINGFCKSGAPVDPMNGMNAVVDSSRMNDEVQFRIVERRFVCTRCGKNFVSKTKLVRHYRTHTVEKPFACDICERRFSQSNALTRHLRTHTSAVPAVTRTHTFACDQCGERYGHEQHLNMHRRTHTGENSYACLICNIAFTRRFSLNRHYMNKHDIKIQ